jgi:hypothetical protein
LAEPPRPLIVIASILTVALVMSGCLSGSDDKVTVGDLETEDTFVDVGEADAVKAYIEMGSGNLRVRPGGDHLMEATIKYNVKQWKPVFTYVEEGEVWNLSVRQPKQDLEVEGDTRNDWELRFGLVIPMEMVVQMGSGEVDIKATGLDLVALSVSTGAGDVDLDLTGTWQNSLVVRVGTGGGDVGIFVPSDVGVQISVIQGAGTVIAPGFEQVQGNYVNDAYQTADFVMLIAVDIGAGDLKVLEVP